MNNMSVSLSGMNSAATAIQRSAARIAKAGDPDGDGDKVDLSAETVAMLNNKAQFSANARAVQALDQVNGAALNILG